MHRFLQWLCLGLGLLWGSAAAAHPQDGPHADLRIAIEDDGVRFSIGVNLAFLDEAIDTAREALNQLSPPEAEAITERLRTYLREDVVVVLDGVTVPAKIEALELFTHPDPGMVALFPRTGARGLIRAVAVLHYPAAQPPAEVAITWPTYPRDILAAETEGAAVLPRMYFEAQLKAEGKLSLIRFSEAEPTVTWRASGIEAAPAVSVPVPPPAEPKQVSVVSAFGGLAAIAAMAWATPALARGKRHELRLAAASVAFGLIAVGARDLAKVDIPGTRGVRAMPEDAVLADIFEGLHLNLYRAFDYTDESDVYDALARSVDGPLLKTIYADAYASLVQAEQGGKLGVVTGLERISLAIDGVEPEAPAGPRFTLRHAWRVDGTVYHWGHSHTQTTEYDAEYGVTGVPAGWRITDMRMLSQQRLDGAVGADAAPAGPPDLQQLLESLGGTDF